MATTPKLTERIDINLHAIGAEADFLPELAVTWDQETAVNQYVWEVEWADLMARLEDLEEAYQGGVMTDEQRAQYHTLRQKLRTHLPLLTQLGLTTPSVPLED